jgi:hypothetical protein
MTATSDHSTPVDALGARRRVQALVAIGYPLADLAGRISVPETMLRNWLKQPLLPAGVDRLLRALYTRLYLTAGPSENARLSARRRCWAPPLAWDWDSDTGYEGIDDPAARPHGVRSCRDRAPKQSEIDWVAVERARTSQPVGRPLTHAERVVLVRQLVERDHATDDLIAELTGLKITSVAQIRFRYDIASGPTEARAAA